jgi:hypothetical protein
MRRIFYLKIIVLALGGMFILNSCSKNDDDVNPIPVDVQPVIVFKHIIGDEMVEFDTIKYTNEFGNVFSVATLKYFVSDFTFHKSDGSKVKLDEEHYVDGRENSTLTYTPSSKIPPGEYTSISFVFGIDSSKNVTGRFPNPPESNMEWPIPMGGGYHYMKFEGKFNENDTIKNFQCHTGPTMGNPNFIEVALSNSGFTTSGNNLNINLQIDLNKWFEYPHELDLNDVTGIMGNQQMQLLLKANGPYVFSIDPLE